jgi:hypothetical protein
VEFEVFREGKKVGRPASPHLRGEMWGTRHPALGELQGWLRTADECEAGEESGDETAEVGGDVGGAVHRAEDEVVNDEDAGGLGDAFDGRWVESVSLSEEEAEDGAVEAEDGS